MKINKALVEDIKGTISVINNNMKDKALNVASIMRKAYIVNINDCTITAISDLMCHPDSYSFEAAASIMAVANKYTFQNGVQSPINIDMAIGVWVASNGFDESSARQAKVMSESYRKMWDNGMAICVFDNNVKILIED